MKFGQALKSRIIFSPSAAESDRLIKTEIVRHSHRKWHYRVVKRSIDFICTSLLIGMLALPGVLIAAAICLDSEGSVFYREERVGRGKLTF
jgi:lipopolysaccharide/colanic/teichoic acid biosynthesis glycosyltransferase